MKLGDNITMEAYNVWEGVAPRKCRPPRIGDIPKHGAVDEESPGSSTKQLTISPTDPGDPSINISLDHTRNIVFPLEPGQPSEKFVSAQKFESRYGCSPVNQDRKNLEDRSSSDRESRDLVDNASLCKRQQAYTTRSTSPIYSTDRHLKESLDPDSRITIKLSPTEESSRRAQLEGRGQESPKIPSSPENTSDQEIVEVRKDSALFLEEAEGFPSLREILKARAPRFVRPRRESSGYASNLGTFDEDRRNSASIDALQDLSSFLKERRRSSTKRLNSRIGLARAEDSLTEELANTGGDRMPTTEVYRKVSSAGLEMPNIEEVKEVLRDEPSSRQESLDNLCSLVERVSAEETSTRCRLQKDVSNPCGTPRGVCTRAESAGESKSSIPDAKSPVFSRDVFDTTPLKESIEDVTSQISSLQYSRNSDKIAHLQSPDTERPDRLEPETAEKDRTAEGAYPKTEKVRQSSRVYQLLSTQSEDTADGEPRLTTDRRTSLEISKRKEDLPLPKPGQEGSTCVETRSNAGTSCDGSPIRKLSSPGEGTTHRYLGDGDAVTVRPIYPYCPYSPYGSPQGSPRNRRRPLRESRRVSIDNRQGALQLNQYKLLDNIGQGSYGIVKLVYNEEDESHYAMKILSKKKLMKKAGIFGRMAPGRRGSANPLAKVYREIALLKKLDHPNVVKLAEVLDDPDEDNLYLVFELVQRGEVLEIPTETPLDEESARKNFRDIVMGVEYLHYQRIVHRDIKPSNLLVDSEGRIKIADLGVSAELRASEELLSGPAGTPAFAAPETTTLGAHYSGTLCDVWSMGVTLYSLVTGRVPWDGAGSIIGVQTAIRTEPLRFPKEPALSDDLRDLIGRMLSKDPAGRITLPEIKEHRWLTRNGMEPLPTEADNCRLPVTVTDEEVERVVTRVPKLDTLILIKTMLKQHSFQNPFLPKKSGRATCTETVAGNLEASSSPGTTESLPRREIVRNLKTERLQKSRRSNSAPDSYDWQANGRQVSMESPLPPVTEASSQESESIERR